VPIPRRRRHLQVNVKSSPRATHPNSTFLIPRRKRCGKLISFWFLFAEYTSSPKKRKATGAHHAAPPPPPPTQSAPAHHHRYSSPSLVSTPGRRGHARQRSDASATARGRGGSIGGHDGQNPQQNQPQLQGWSLPSTGSNVAEGTGQGTGPDQQPSVAHHQPQQQHHHHPAQRNRAEELSESGSFGSPRMSTRRSGGHSQHPSSGRSSAVTSPPEAGQASSSRSEAEY
jgi:hypothetical protein